MEGWNNFHVRSLCRIPQTCRIYIHLIWFTPNHIPIPSSWGSPSTNVFIQMETSTTFPYLLSFSYSSQDIHLVLISVMSHVVGTTADHLIQSDSSRFMLISLQKTIWSNHDPSRLWGIRGSCKMVLNIKKTKIYHSKNVSRQNVVLFWCYCVWKRVGLFTPLYFIEIFRIYQVEISSLGQLSGIIG